MITINRPGTVSLTPTRLILLLAIFLVITGNWAFFDRVLNIYPWNVDNAGFLISLVIILCCVLVLLAVIFSMLLPVRVVASMLILMAAMVGYFSDQLGIVIDSGMIRNILETDTAEAADLISYGLALRLLLLGIVPVALIWWLPFRKSGTLRELRYKAQTAAAAIVIIAIGLFPLGDHYASFLREHKPVRFYANPVFPIYSISKYTGQALAGPEAHAFMTLANYAQRTPVDTHRELVILVIGETARSDHFSLNGYQRNTNPRLSMEKRLISYSDISSCGTSTATSVPCMFAYAGRQDFDLDSSGYTENILDILKRAGVEVLWRDNNSDSKGVATRVNYQDFKSPGVNTDCDVECRDLGMLDGLQEYIDAQQGEILIVLHQMGSHGPAYFNRYPKAFEKFTPACQSIELSKCSNDEIINAYDNSILYTDYFLSKVIELLKHNTPRFETAMFYVSDHGESLGESGVYLHGMPYLFAPDEQIKVPIMVWVGDSSDIDYEKSLVQKTVPNSHDALFGALLSSFEIETDLTHPGNQPLVYLKDDFDVR